jgi:hypothetical protein
MVVSKTACEGSNPSARAQHPAWPGRELCQLHSGQHERCTRPSARRCRRSGHQSGARELVDPSALGAEDTAFDSPVPDVRACSAVGSASVRQTEGPGFESPQVHPCPPSSEGKSARLKPGRFSVRSGGRALLDRWSSGDLASFSARRRPVRSRHGLRGWGVHGDMPLFQSGVAGSTPVNRSRSGVRRWRP